MIPTFRTLALATVGCLLILVPVAFAGRRNVWHPKRCCAPDQFTANVKDMLTSYKFYSESEQPVVDFSYDWPGRRWAMRVGYKGNDTFARLMYDHDKGKQVFQTDKSCHVTDVGKEMLRYCITKNASFDGEYTYGYGDKTLTVNQWSFDLAAVPLRSVRSVSADNCMPIQEIKGNVVGTNRNWVIGQPGCIPWEEPEKAAKDKCYKSYKKRKVNAKIIDYSATMLNLMFRNMELGLTKPELFDIPENCSPEADKEKEETWNWFKMVWYLMRTTFNPDDPFGDISFKPIL